MTTNGFLAGLSYDSRPYRDDEAAKQARSDRLACTLLRKYAFRHDSRCAGACRHRNHARDRQHLDLLLDMLGLDDAPARREDYENGIAWHAVSRSEMALMQGKAA